MDAGSDCGLADCGFEFESRGSSLEPASRLLLVASTRSCTMALRVSASAFVPGALAHRVPDQVNQDQDIDIDISGWFDALSVTTLPEDSGVVVSSAELGTKSAAACDSAVMAAAAAEVDGGLDVAVGTPGTTKLPSELLSLHGAPGFLVHPTSSSLDTSAALAAAAACARAQDGTILRTAHGDVLRVRPMLQSSEASPWFSGVMDIGLCGFGAADSGGRVVMPGDDVPRDYPHVPDRVPAGGLAAYITQLPGGCFIDVPSVGVHRTSAAGQRVMRLLGPPPAEGAAADMAAMDLYEARYWAALRDDPPPGVLGAELAAKAAWWAGLVRDDAALALEHAAPGVDEEVVDEYEEAAVRARAEDRWAREAEFDAVWGVHASDAVFAVLAEAAGAEGEAWGEGDAA